MDNDAEKINKKFKSAGFLKKVVIYESLFNALLMFFNEGLKISNAERKSALNGLIGGNSERMGNRLIIRQQVRMTRHRV